MSEIYENQMKTKLNHNNNNCDYYDYIYYCISHMVLVVIINNPTQIIRRYCAMVPMMIMMIKQNC